jgi:hypothetical protein
LQASGGLQPQSHWFGDFDTMMQGQRDGARRPTPILSAKPRASLFLAVGDWQHSIAGAVLHSSFLKFKPASETNKPNRRILKKR